MNMIAQKRDEIKSLSEMKVLKRAVEIARMMNETKTDKTSLDELDRAFWDNTPNHIKARAILVSWGEGATLK